MSDKKQVASYWRSGAIFQVPFLVVAICCFFWQMALPSVAMGVLAVAAVIMTVRAERFTPAERALWILIAFLLFVVEI